MFLGGIVPVNCLCLDKSEDNIMEALVSPLKSCYRFTSRLRQQCAITCISYNMHIFVFLLNLSFYTILLYVVLYGPVSAIKFIINIIIISVCYTICLCLCTCILLYFRGHYTLASEKGCFHFCCLAAITVVMAYHGRKQEFYCERCGVKEADL